MDLTGASRNWQVLQNEGILPNCNGDLAKRTFSFGEWFCSYMNFESSTKMSADSSPWIYIFIMLYKVFLTQFHLCELNP